MFYAYGHGFEGWITWIQTNGSTFTALNYFLQKTNKEKNQTQQKIQFPNKIKLASNSLHIVRHQRGER